jgi:FdhD protein
MGVAGAQTVARRVVRHERGAREVCEDRVVVEEPLEIRLDGEPLAVTMRTPGHDEELAAGFCLTEGIVRQADDLESVVPCSVADYGNVVDVVLTEAARTQRAAAVGRARRELYLSSSCGLCGKQSIDRIEQRISPLPAGPVVSRQLLASLPERMRGAQDAFAETGGLHAAAIFSPAGELIVLREDVGRHNAVDKTIGRELLLGRAPLQGVVLLVSGRASFEILQKAAIAGIALVCAVSAPSSLAIDLALRLGMTLVGFLRPGRLNVYGDQGRWLDPKL